MFRLTHLTAGVLALALLIAVPAAATGLMSNGARGASGTAAKKACKKGTTRSKSGKCVKRKPCTKRQTRNRNGKCVAKRVAGSTGVVPPDDAFGYKSSDAGL
jgi:hypothetical protein